MKASKNGMQAFLEISVYLTGFSQQELQGTGMLETYYNVMVNKNNIAVVEAFLSKSEEIIDQNNNRPETLRNEILTNLLPDSLYNGLAKNIITMWYLGSWVNEIISPQSYVQGMIWGVAGAHPPGAKQPGFASWSIAPDKI